MNQYANEPEDYNKTKFCICLYDEEKWNYKKKIQLKDIFTRILCLKYLFNCETKKSSLESEDRWWKFKNAQ